jgi:predicted metal-dependent HD superfamily phosphohydrolase
VVKPCARSGDSVLQRTKLISAMSSLSDIYQVFTVAPELKDKWVRFLDSAYGDPHRRYHNHSHLQSMFDQLNNFFSEKKFSPQELTTLHLAIWFHDVVYDTTAPPGSNECLSALKFGEYAREVVLVLSPRRS